MNRRGARRPAHENLRLQSGPFLEDGEVVKNVFVAVGGTAAGVALSSGGVPTLLGWVLRGRFYAIVVTNQSIILFSLNYFTRDIAKGIVRLPRATRLSPSPPNGAPGAGWVTVDGRALMLMSEEAREAALAADAELDEHPRLDDDVDGG